MRDSIRFQLIAPAHSFIVGFITKFVNPKVCEIICSVFLLRVSFFLMIYVVEQSPGLGIFGLAEGTYRFGKP